MITWNDRLLPHPLLASWTEDYGDATFVATVPDAVLNNGKHINLTIKYHLTSPYLREFISCEKAQYVALIACTKTSNRNTYVSNQDDDILLLEAGDYAQELIFTPYVVATRQIEGFVSKELAEEFRDIRPSGFTILPASILAVGESTRITLEKGGSPYSVMDLVKDPNIESGSFEVDLDHDRIKIHVAPGDKERVEALRQHASESTEVAVLFPSIYLHAVTEALRNLSDYPNTRWAYTMRQALELHNITADDEDVQDNALKYAQTLMERPVGRLLTAFTNRDAEE
ncbi:MAG: hypothetical protein OXE05_02930 [Chloroflexi bacterium]|nr:hypothetical protein [Chloroflexota bacterium]